MLQELMGENTKAAMRIQILPLLTIVLLLTLGFFAFRGGFTGMDATGLVTLGNTSLMSSLLISDEISIAIDHSMLTVNSGEKIVIETDGRTINVSGGLDLRDFDGTVEWDGDAIVAEGSMESLSGGGVDIIWKQREKAVITMTSGLAEVHALELGSFSRDATGRIALEGRLSFQLNQTPLAIKDFSGRVYLQHVNNDTTLGLEGTAGHVSIEAENIIKALI
jgi:hypothetical protein